MKEWMDGGMDGWMEEWRDRWQPFGLTYIEAWCNIASESFAVRRVCLLPVLVLVAPSLLSSSEAL